MAGVVVVVVAGAVGVLLVAAWGRQWREDGDLGLWRRRQRADQLEDGRVHIIEEAPEN